jgi:hypothetical protein
VEVKQEISTPLLDFAEAQYARTHETRFQRYHAENPHVYEAFKHFTLEAIRSGRKRLGARMVIERMRWESTVRGTGEYKLNDHYTPFYVRLFIQEFPQHADLFSMRSAKADRELV